MLIQNGNGDYEKKIHFKNGKISQEYSICFFFIQTITLC